MRVLPCILATLMLWGVSLSANAQQFKNPKNGTDLLDYCSEIVNLLDGATLDSVKDMKFAWCTGYIAATYDGIDDWRMLASMQNMNAAKGGSPAPPYTWADDNFVNTCIPDDVSTGQLARVIVKWLREHPENLHEMRSILVMKALRSAFPCEHVKEPPKTAKP